MNAEERRRKSQRAAYALHQKYDSRELSAPARAASQQSLRKRLDPEERMTPEEWTEAKSNYFRSLNQRSVAVRSKPKPGKKWRIRKACTWYLYQDGEPLTDPHGNPKGFQSWAEALEEATSRNGDSVRMESQ